MRYSTYNIEMNYRMDDHFKIMKKYTHIQIKSYIEYFHCILHKQRKMLIKLIVYTFCALVEFHFDSYGILYAHKH